MKIITKVVSETEKSFPIVIDDKYETVKHNGLTYWARLIAVFKRSDGCDCLMYEVM